MAYANDYFAGQTYVYGYFYTEDQAIEALTEYMALGQVSECEVSRIYRAFGGMWAIELKA
jgi:hypothetical protein